MNVKEAVYELVRERGAIVAGKPGNGVVTQVSKAVGCSRERANISLMQLEAFDRIVIDPPYEPGKRGPRPITRVTVRVGVPGASG
mgnify:FL=1